MLHTNIQIKLFCTGKVKRDLQCLLLVKLFNCQMSMMGLLGPVIISAGWIGLILKILGWV